MAECSYKKGKVMNILVTNDDGIDSPGLWAVAEALTRVGNVLIVAPDKQQSGMGSSVSLHSETPIREIPSPVAGARAFSVGGTPSDCSMVGIRRLRQERTDLLVSGINIGPNVGRDVVYSGTVMATLQGYFRKIPSIAISLVLHDGLDKPLFDVASGVVTSLAQCIKRGEMPGDCILNVNVPNIPQEQIKGIKVTKAAPSGYIRAPQPTAQGTKYGRGRSKHVSDEQMTGTDIQAIDEGYVSITPLRFELTHYDLMLPLRNCVAGLDCGLGVKDSGH
jgi:5'-nucleotidase